MIHKIYKIGIIGTGMIAEIHAENMMRENRAVISGVYSRTTEKRKNFADKFKVSHECSSLAELLNLEGLDAIVIATPPHTHCEILAKTVKKGIPVWIEKPLAISVSDAEQMTLMLDQLPLAVTSSGRHSRLQPKFKAVRKILAEGTIGSIYSIQHHAIDYKRRYGIEYHPDASWALDLKQAGGGPLLDWGVYDLSFHLGLLGDPDIKRLTSWSVNGMDPYSKENLNFTVEEHGAIEFRISDSIPYSYERSSHSYGKPGNETVIYGSCGSLRFNYLSWGEPIIEIYLPSSIDQPEKRVITVDMESHPGDQEAMADHFLDCLDGTAQPIINAETELRILRVLLDRKECRSMSFD